MVGADPKIMDINLVVYESLQTPRAIQTTSANDGGVGFRSSGLSTGIGGLS